MTRLEVALSLSIFVFATGCGNSSHPPSNADAKSFPVPGCEQLDSTPCDVRVTACQVRLLSMAACLRQQAPIELPPITLMTESEYALYVSALSAPEPASGGPNHAEIAAIQLGLAAAGSFEESALVDERAKHVAGEFRPEHKDVLIIDHGDALDDAGSNAILVHEFVHVLQDRDIGLADFETRHVRSADTWLAAKAMVEGEASRHQARYSAAALGVDPTKVDWHEQFQAIVERDEAHLVTSPSSYVDSFGVFPYEWGARYMNLAWEAGQLSEARALVARPPGHTRTLMASVEAIANSELEAAGFEPLTPSAEWSAITPDSLGAWGVFLVLGRWTSVARARELALNWRGDALSVYASGAQNAETLLSWRLELADAESAGALAALARAHFGADSVRRKGSRVALVWASNGALGDWAFTL